jgi:hypothetical protein
MCILKNPIDASNFYRKMKDQIFNIESTNTIKFSASKHYNSREFHIGGFGSSVISRVNAKPP